MDNFFSVFLFFKSFEMVHLPCRRQISIPSHSLTSVLLILSPNFLLSLFNLNFSLFKICNWKPKDLCDAATAAAAADDDNIISEYFPRNKKEKYTMLMTLTRIKV